jgi:hypothetical protein
LARWDYVTLVGDDDGVGPDCFKRGANSLNTNLGKNSLFREIDQNLQQGPSLSNKLCGHHGVPTRETPKRSCMNGSISVGIVVFRFYQRREVRATDHIVWPELHHCLSPSESDLFELMLSLRAKQIHRIVES